MAFNAAKDLVYSIDGNNVTSGGYRINKILNGTNTAKKRQKGGKKHSSEKTEFFNEDSGIPVGLLLLQSQHKYLIHSPSPSKSNHDKSVDKSVDKSQDNFVYIVNEDEHEDEGNNEELVIMPSYTYSSSSSPLENSIHISSNEIDDDLYDVLLKNASYSESESSLKKNKDSTKKRHFGAHVEKVFQKRKTRSKRRG
jgi:hypothetical protein